MDDRDKEMREALMNGEGRETLRKRYGVSRQYITALRAELGLTRRGGVALSIRDLDKLKKRLEDGAMLKECAAEFGITESAVCNYKRKWGLSRCYKDSKPHLQHQHETPTYRPPVWESAELVLKADATRALLIERDHVRVLFKSKPARRALVAYLAKQLEAADGD